MKVTIAYLGLILLALSPPTDVDPGSFAAEQNGIPLSLYKQRRERLLAAMDSNSIAIFTAAESKNRNGDTDYRYRQNDNLWYLTGFPEGRSVLLLSKRPLTVDGHTTREILFVRGKNRMMETWTGPIIGSESARIDYGIDATQTIDRLRSLIDSLLPGVTTLYYDSGLPSLRDPVSGMLVYTTRKIRDEFLQKNPALRFRSLKPNLVEMRMIKSREEIALIRKAVDATVAAHIEVMKSCEPGMYEYDLQGIVEYCFLRMGAEYSAFPSIIASGPNSTILHYDRNRRQIRKGEVIVLDIGAEYAGYSADVTRTIPADATFTTEQREIYDIVLRAQEAGIAAIRPGARMDEIHEAVSKVISEAGYGPYLIHGVSHHIGLNVHDVSSGSVLRPGMVITVEPGIYVNHGAPLEEKYWGTGIRVEDDVLVTEDGFEILSEDAPRSIGEIERLMKKRGIGNQPFGR